VAAHEGEIWRGVMRALKIPGMVSCGRASFGRAGMVRKSMETPVRYDELEIFLRHLHNVSDPLGQYDFNGIVHLMLALLDNLQENALEAELEDIKESMTDEQVTFFLKIAEFIK
jgi:hypothetical protein